MLKVAILGASGYTGSELLRILLRHPKVRIAAATSEQSAGRPVVELFPHLAGRLELVLEPMMIEPLIKKADLFFLALPHTKAMSVAAELIRKGKKVVDLSADFRIKDPEVYRQWYKTAHTNPDLLPSAVYGLPELYSDAIRKASLVASPGCYPTGALLGLAPLVKESLVDYDGILIDAKSGVSGAGRSPSLAYHFPEINESVSPYSVAGHRHQPEIEQELAALAGEPVLATFVPHLIPMTRGLLTTIYVRMKRSKKSTDWRGLFQKFYKDAPFIQVLPSDRWPNTREVRGSNVCQIGVMSDPRTDRLIVVTAIDNLVKGGSGQAVQNMNWMMGFEETLGLEDPALFP